MTTVERGKRKGKYSREERPNEAGTPTTSNKEGMLSFFSGYIGLFDGISTLPSLFFPPFPPTSTGAHDNCRTSHIFFSFHTFFIRPTFFFFCCCLFVRIFSIFFFLSFPSLKFSSYVVYLFGGKKPLSSLNRSPCTGQYIPLFLPLSPFA